MLDFSNPETMWLNLTNLGLGVVTLLAVVGVGIVVVKELVSRLSLTAPSTQHSFHHPELGLTMADGGEPIAKETAPSTTQASGTKEKSSA